MQWIGQKTIMRIPARHITESRIDANGNSRYKESIGMLGMQMRNM